MFVNPSEIVNAVAVPMISMAKITGIQSAKNTLQSLWDATITKVPYPSVDVRAITTSGLYENTPIRDPHVERYKKLKNLSKFQRQWDDVIKDRAAKNDIIIPTAYNVMPWDAVVQDRKFISPFTQCYGFLKHEFDVNKLLQQTIERQSDEMSRENNEAQKAFWLEEYTQIFSIAAGLINFPLTENSLRMDLKGPTLLLYPGSMDEAGLLSLSVLSKKSGVNLIEGRSFWVDTSVPDKAKFMDIALAIP